MTAYPTPDNHGHWWLHTLRAGHRLHAVADWPGGQKAPDALPQRNDVPAETAGHGYRPGPLGHWCCWPVADGPCNRNVEHPVHHPAAPALDGPEHCACSPLIPTDPQRCVCRIPDATPTAEGSS